MNHLQILNYLIHKYNYQTYLEIGVYDGNNFDQIDIILENKESCDISNKMWTNKYPITYLMSSDEMFEKMSIDKKYDIIFIDGMHDEEYVDRDIINSLKHLNPGGVICLHDAITINPLYQITYECYDNLSYWNGNVWKSITKLQENNLEFYTVQNNDWGLTIIKYKDNPYSLTVPKHKSNVRYEYVFNNTEDFNTCLTEQGKYVLHVISEKEFLEKF